MRLIGKMHDYYDSALAFGADPSLVFVRESVELPQSDPLSKAMTRVIFPNDARTWMDDVLTSTTYRVVEDASIFVIGFCGILYAGVRVSDSFGYPSNMTDIDKYLTDKENKAFAEYLLNQNSYTKKSPLDRIMKKVDSIDGLYTPSLFIDNKCPYFSAEVTQRNNVVVTKVPVLKDFAFQKIKDPYSAFQEISMYMGGVIPRQTPETINISDKDRIVQHGFDKFSFRHPVK